MMVVRVLLQVVIVVMFLLILSGALLKPLTPSDVAKLLGGLLFFAMLFVASLSIGEKKEKQSAHILGYPVNPKTFGTMLIIFGASLLVAAGLFLSGSPIGESRANVRGGGFLEMLFQAPVLLIPAGLAAAWYGVKLCRGRQPKRTRDAED